MLQKFSKGSSSIVSGGVRDHLLVFEVPQKMPTKGSKYLSMNYRKMDIKKNLQFFNGLSLVKVSIPC